MDQITTLKHGPLARQIITDTLGFEPAKNKPFTFSDNSQTGNDYLHQDKEYWYVKNFATGESYSSIDVYMFKTRSDFSQAVKDLSAKYLNGQSTHTHLNGHYNNRTEDKPFQAPVLRSVKDFTTAEIEYWKQFGISGKMLQVFNVWAVSAYFDYSWNKNTNDWYGYQVQPNEKNGGLIFAYKVSDECYKIYRPLHTEKNKRFLWLGYKPDTFTDVWGVDLIPDNVEIILICEGLKDALTINSHLHCFEQNLWAIAKENAQNQIHPDLITALTDQYTVLLCLDADQAGQKATLEQSKAYGLGFIDLHSFITHDLGYDISPDLKDVSDIFRIAYSQLMEGETITDLKSAFTSLVTGAAPAVANEQENKSSYNPIANPKSALRILTANQTLMNASQRKNPRKLFGPFWYEDEVSIFFADTNTGKSIAGVQIGDCISSGRNMLGLECEAGPQPVIYCDFELSDKQFELRYSQEGKNHYQFSETFFRAEINPDADLPEGVTFEDFLIQSLEAVIEQTQARVIIIDNITYLRVETERAKDALPLMKQLKALKSKHGLSILALAHTPKRNMALPLGRNDLQGSKMLINFCDSSFALGESFQDKSLRYFKQIKVRNSEHIYDTENVLLCQVTKPGNFLQFEFIDFAREKDHLKEPSERDKQEIILKAKELSTQGKSQREISKELAISVGAVNKYLKT